MIRVVRYSERPDLVASLQRDALDDVWPVFMQRDPIANLYFGTGRLERYHDFAFLAYDEAKPGIALGRAYSVPFCLGDEFGRPELPDDGWDGVIRWADQDTFLQRKTNAVSALEITLHPELAGRGFSARMVEAMRRNAANHGFRSLYAPVRPNRKHLDPLTPMRDYALRLRDDGLPVDPWLRVHARLGARIVKIAPCSMTVAGTLEEWRRWTGLPFDAEGDVAIPGALVPVHVSLRQNHAVYVEPNVWMQHDV